MLASHFGPSKAGQFTLEDCGDASAQKVAESCLGNYDPSSPVPRAAGRGSKVVL
jgi:hypothetical protein